MKIYKYRLPSISIGQGILELPIGFKILCLQVQDAVPMIWVLVDEKAITKVKQEFVTFDTGDLITNLEGMTYLGTYQLNGYVSHVYTRNIENPY